MSNPFADMKLEVPVLAGAPLAGLTTWKVGGPAQWFWEPTRADVPAVLAHCHERGIRTTFIGRGSNILVDDAGIEGLVLCTRRALLDLSSDARAIDAGAGVTLPSVARLAGRSGFGGFEFLVGIPGSVGGGITMNCGITTLEVAEIKSVLSQVEVVDARGGVDVVRDAAALRMAYRTSAVRENGWFVLSARFAPTSEANPEDLMKKMAVHLADRKRKQPLTKATAGSTFKSPPGGRAAGWYIDQCGLKGLTVGAALVSPKHANWIENSGGATSRDILEIIERIQSAVELRFGIHLEPEVQHLR